MGDTEHKVLVALAARKIEASLRESLRDHGEMLNLLGTDPKSLGLFSLDIVEEAVKTIRYKVQEQQERQRKGQ